jgi:hypothetical protein
MFWKRQIYISTFSSTFLVSFKPKLFIYNIFLFPNDKPLTSPHLPFTYPHSSQAMQPPLPPLPLTSLPAWCKLNGVSFLDTTISSLPSGRGNGIVATKALNSLDTYDIPTLLEVGKDVVLDGDLLLEMQRVDKGFRDLVECVRGKETEGRGKVGLLFLYFWGVGWQLGRGGMEGDFANICADE